MGDRSESLFFWFDPFGNAPTDATVSGSAGGVITWGGAPGWPFERNPSSTPLMDALFGRRYSQPHIQLRTAVDPDAPPPVREFTQITHSRRLVRAALNGGRDD